MTLDCNMSAEEQHELDLLAAELRAAQPLAVLSEDFQERLESRMRHSWTLRSAFQRNPVIRVAAGLLVMTLAAAPVAALVGLWPQQKKNPPAIAFEPHEEIEVDDSGAAGAPGANQVIGPIDEFDGFVWTEQRSLAIQQSNYYNRLQYAGATLNASGRSAVFAGISAAHGAVPVWERLWMEFGKRCQSNAAEELPESLLALAQKELETAASAHASPIEIASRAAWAWLLHGEVAPAGSVELAWPDAPFVASP
jgi:hypothetical protein